MADIAFINARFQADNAARAALEAELAANAALVGNQVPANADFAQLRAVGHATANGARTAARYAATIVPRRAPVPRIIPRAGPAGREVAAEMIARPAVQVPQALPIDDPHVDEAVAAEWRTLIPRADLQRSGTSVNALVNEVIRQRRALGAGADDKYLVTVYQQHQILDARGNWANRGGSNYSYPPNALPQMDFIAEDGIVMGSDTDETNRRIVETVIIDNLTEEDAAIDQGELDYIPRPNVRRGGFFKYLAPKELPLDLTKYQVFAEFKVKQDQCFIHTLQMSSILEPAEMQAARINLKKFDLGLSQLKKLAVLLKIGIILTTVDNENVSKVRKYNLKNVPEARHVSVGWIAGHYFLNEVLDCTRFAIKNWKDCSEFAAEKGKNWKMLTNRVGNSFVARAGAKMVTSFQTIRQLLRDNQLTPLTEQQLAQTVHHKATFTDVAKSDLNVPCVSRPVKYTPKKQKTYDAIVMFDTEAATGGAKHMPYLVSYAEIVANRDMPIESCFGADCIKDFLRVATEGRRHILLYAHNLGYDLAHTLEELNVVTTVIKRGMSIYNCEGKFNGCKLTFRDSLALINMPLRKFPEMFAGAYPEGMKKEAYPYGLYTVPNKVRKVGDQIAFIEAAKPHMGVADYEVFKANIAEQQPGWYEYGLFDMEAYAIFYCEQDVRLLRGGLKMFRDQIDTLASLDLYDYLSIASISHSFMKAQGAYDGVNELAGVHRDFIQKTIRGGRVMCADNAMWKVERPMDDFDAVSLYPSAMAMMPGLPTGDPTVIDADCVGSSKDGVLAKLQGRYTAFYVRIMIDAVGKSRHFPQINHVDEKGSLQYVNECVEMYVDNIALEDLVTFQKVEFTVIEGLGYAGALNTNIKNVIQKLFDERLRIKEEAKKNGAYNPLEKVIKLLLNSSYGKTLECPHDTEFKVIRRKNSRRYMLKHYNEVASRSRLCEKFDVYELRREVYSHFNMAHIGSLILSMSKRIMNQVMCLAEDEGFSIVYQDTDSMHLPTEQVAPLAAAFEAKYGRELIGKQMGQFHTDFELHDKTKGIFSEKSFFVGKKCYVDLLTDGKGDSGEHVRFKGVSGTAVFAFAEQHGLTILQVYEKLYNGERLTFDLCATVQGKAAKVKFKKPDLVTYQTIDSFCRTVQFENADKRILQ